MRAIVVPLIAIVAIFAILMSFIGMLEYMVRQRNRSPENHSSDLFVSSSKLYIAPDNYQSDGQEQLAPLVIGEMQNKGAQVLDDIRLEARIFDAKDQLIDVFDDYVQGPLKPGEKLAFKLNGQPIHLQEAEYKRHEVLVR
jgi:chromosome condensin MukBEF complex kleisin-like MukF subunit